MTLPLIIKDGSLVIFMRRRLPAFMLGLFVVAPILFIIELAFFGDDPYGAWEHILAVNLERTILTTLLLVVGVCVCSLLLGLSSAWLVTLYQFPLVQLFRVALLLPLSIPSYIIAFVYTDLASSHVPIRSLGGAIVILSLAFYPYVYLFVRAALLEQSSCVFEAGRTLGCSSLTNFTKVAIPLLRPALVASCALVGMETLADFGTVHYFALPVFTVGIYDAWLTMNSLTAAARLSCLLLLFILVVMVFEHYGRGGGRYHPAGAKKERLATHRLEGREKIFAILFCLLLFGFGFGIPFLFLLSSFLTSSVFEVSFLTYGMNSIAVSSLGALLAGGLGFALAWSSLPPASRLLGLWMRLGSMGYAVPGAVLAIGVLMTFSSLDDLFSLIGFSALLLSSVAGLLYGYVVRFIAIPHGMMRTSLERITPQMEDAARTLGQESFAILRRVYVPMAQRSFWAGCLFVFVECMKELPLTLLVRPLNYETLATWIWQYASSERFSEVAHGALMLVCVGILPVIFMSRAMERDAKEEKVIA